MHVNRQISYMSVPYRLRVLVLVALAVAVGFFTTTAGAASPQKHSGRIASIGPLTQAVTLEEVGRWTGPDARLVKRSFEVLPTTSVELITRSAHLPGEDWPGGFQASTLAASDLRGR